MRPSPLAAAALTLAIALSACAGDGGDGADDGGDTTTTAEAGDLGAGCALLPPAELAELLDRELDAPRETSTDGDLGCSYRSRPSKDADDVVFASIAVQPDGAPNYDDAVAAYRRRAQRVSDLGGVGDRAVFFVSTQGQASAYQAMTRSGDVLATFVVAGRLEESAARDAGVTALTRVLERLDR